MKNHNGTYFFHFYDFIDEVLIFFFFFCNPLLSDHSLRFLQQSQWYVFIYFLVFLTKNSFLKNFLLSDLTYSCFSFLVFNTCFVYINEWLDKMKKVGKNQRLKIGLRSHRSLSNHKTNIISSSMFNTSWKNHNDMYFSIFMVLLTKFQFFLQHSSFLPFFKTSLTITMLCIYPFFGIYYWQSFHF